MTQAGATHPSLAIPPETKTRDVAYWAIMSLLFACRCLFTWVYFVVSYSAFRAFLQMIRQSSAHFQLRDLLGISFPLVSGLISGAAWWTTLRNSRSHKIWVILFCLGCLLTLSPWISGTPSARYLLAYSVILVPALGGMLVFLLPYRLRLSMNVSSYRINSPCHKCEGELMTPRSLRSWGYWAIMFLLSAGRLAMIWAYWSFLEHLAEVLRDEFREAPKYFILAMAAFIAVMGFTGAMAGWAAWRKSRTQRTWEVIACLVYLLAAIILFANSFSRHSATSSREILVIALGGLLVYALPYRLQWSVNLCSYRVNSPDSRPRELRFSI